MNQIEIREGAVYIFALGLLKGVGPQTQRLLVSSFPTVQDLQQASQEQLEKSLPSSVALSIAQQVYQSPEIWAIFQQKARDVINHHLQVGIIPIPITDRAYPPLLKKIPDPPVILYAKGNISLLQQISTVAIIGTREPTEKGKNVALHLAHYFAEAKYCIVSGLAKGIDTAAHEGALEAEGYTIAVFGTPLDQVYPAANKDLAKRIVDTDGLLVSELPLGQKGFRSSFVSRDRIQSGLSLGIIPVQTKVDGGTMHTVHFAQLQERLIACPIPLQIEGQASQYEGIYALLRGKAPSVYAFKAGQVAHSDILDHLQNVRQHLLSKMQQLELNEVLCNKEITTELQSQLLATPSEETAISVPTLDNTSSVSKNSEMPSRRKKVSTPSKPSTEDDSSSGFSYEVPAKLPERRVAETSTSYQNTCVQISLW